jgi:hypothetical protein
MAEAASSACQGPATVALFGVGILGLVLMGGRSRKPLV